MSIVKLKIKQGDTVAVIAGSHKGKTGKVLKVYPKTMRVKIEGVNLVKRHMKASAQNPQGGIAEMEKPIHYSNVQLVDANGKPTRVGVKVEKKGKEVVRTRFAKTTKAALPSASAKK